MKKNTVSIYGFTHVSQENLKKNSTSSKFPRETENIREEEMRIMFQQGLINSIVLVVIRLAYLYGILTNTRVQLSLDWFYFYEYPNLINFKLTLSHICILN